MMVYGEISQISGKGQRLLDTAVVFFPRWAKVDRKHVPGDRIDFASDLISLVWNLFTLITGYRYNCSDACR